MNKESMNKAYKSEKKKTILQTIPYRRLAKNDFFPFLSLPRFRICKTEPVVRLAGLAFLPWLAFMSTGIRGIMI